MSSRRVRSGVGALLVALVAGAACGNSDSRGSPAGERAGMAGLGFGFAGANASAGGHGAALAAGRSGAGGGAGVTSGGGGAEAAAGAPGSAGAPDGEAGGSGAGEAGNAALGGGTSAGAAGTAGAVSTEPKPSNLLITFGAPYTMRECADGSTSAVLELDRQCTTGPTRWDVVSAAFVEFLQSSASAGLGVALRFFPSDEPAAGCDGYSTQIFPGFGGMAGSSSRPPGPNCDASACAVPLVELERLTADAAPADAQEAKLVAAVQGMNPVELDLNQPNFRALNPQSPWSAALAGAAQWAASYHASHPEQETGILLVVDQAPEGCDTSFDAMAATAAGAYKNSQVRTYVLDVGPGAASLDKVTLAGGSTGPLLAPDGPNLARDVLAALSAIRDGDAEL